MTTPDPIEELRSRIVKLAVMMQHDDLRRFIDAYDAKCAELERLKGERDDLILQKTALERTLDYYE